MKSKIFLLACGFVLGSVVANASDNIGDPGNPGKKDDILGSVVNSDNKKPLRDVSITAYLSSKKEKVVITDGCGSYAFDDLKPGVYKFVFEKEGFKKVTRERVTVRVDEGFQLDIEMVLADADLLPAPAHFLYN